MWPFQGSFDNCKLKQIELLKIVKLKVPLKVLVKVRVKVRTWSGQVRSPTPKWDLSYTLKLVSTHHHHTISKSVSRGKSS